MADDFIHASTKISVDDRIALTSDKCADRKRAGRPPSGERDGGPRPVSRESDCGTVGLDRCIDHFIPRRSSRRVKPVVSLDRQTDVIPKSPIRLIRRRSCRIPISAG